jgi:hypothetical protein
LLALEQFFNRLVQYRLYMVYDLFKFIVRQVGQSDDFEERLDCPQYVIDVWSDLIQSLFTHASSSSLSHETAAAVDLLLDRLVVEI